MTHVKPLLALMLTFALAVSPLVAQEGRALYDLGISLYRERSNEEAREALESFVNDNPESVKYDDALWYLGRLYNRLDRPMDAESVFKQILSLPESNRFTEAGYDLGKMYFSEKRYEEVIGLLAPAVEADDPDSYEQRSIRLVAMSRYNLGVRAKAEYRDAEAERLYTQAAETYEMLLTYEEDPVERGDIHYSIGKAYDRVLSLAQSNDAFELYRERAEENLREALQLADEKDRPEIARILKSVEDEGAVSYKLSGNALGGVDRITSAFGAKVFVDSYVRIPLNWRNELEIGATYSHNDFSFKTSNFDDTKIGDLRLIDTNDKIGADVGWTIGSRRAFRNELTVEGDMLFAGDPGDDYWSVEAANGSIYRLGPDLRIGLDESFLYKIYPDYLVAGNKLDHYLVFGSPWVEWEALSWLDVTTAYEFSFKQYLASTYDTSSGAPSTLNKQYIGNTGILELDAKLGTLFSPKLTYEIKYQESNNYDYWVSGNPADIFIEDYYDYLKHTLDLELDFDWTDALTTQVGVTGSLKNFTNYIARDETKTFIGENRRDLGLSVDAEIGYTVFSKDKSSIGLLVRGWWDIAQSNMTYETSFDTNHDTYGIVAGIDFNLR